LRQFTLLALARYPNAPAYLLGESFGGLVGLRLLHDSPALFTAAAFSSPGIDFQTNGVPRGILKMRHDAVVLVRPMQGLCADAT
jgi:alpha-beta hydrolase superfamily lysophospholipase